MLAAGQGKRYGYAAKVLAPFNGVPLVAHTLAAIQRTALRPVIVVTGPRHATIARICRRSIRPTRRLRVVRNRRYHEGMAHSLQQGIRALPACSDAALICLADMPYTSSYTIKRLCSGWHADLDYLRPVHAGRPGHPVVISRRLFGQFDALRGDQGAQGIFARVPAERRRLLSAGDASITDVDTPKALRRAWRSRGRRK